MHSDNKKVIVTQIQLTVSLAVGFISSAIAKLEKYEAKFTILKTNKCTILSSIV
jgi:hypothetical protein